jgi:hypothetical protein
MITFTSATVFVGSASTGNFPPLRVFTSSCILRNCFYVVWCTEGASTVIPVATQSTNSQLFLCCQFVIFVSCMGQDQESGWPKRFEKELVEWVKALDLASWQWRGLILFEPSALHTTNIFSHLINHCTSNHSLLHSVIFIVIFTATPWRMQKNRHQKHLIKSRFISLL